MPGPAHRIQRFLQLSETDNLTLVPTSHSEWRDVRTAHTHPHQRHTTYPSLLLCTTEKQSLTFSVDNVRVCESVAFCFFRGAVVTIVFNASSPVLPLCSPKQADPPVETNHTQSTYKGFHEPLPTS